MIARISMILELAFLSKFLKIIFFIEGKGIIQRK